MGTLRNLRRLPGHILAWLALLMVSGGVDLAYHTIGLALGAGWVGDLLHATADGRFYIDLGETMLHALVALALVALAISYLAYRTAEEERRQRERERKRGDAGTQRPAP